VKNTAQKAAKPASKRPHLNPNGLHPISLHDALGRKLEALFQAKRP
jgi:hypothetical protein